MDENVIFLINQLCETYLEKANENNNLLEAVRPLKSKILNNIFSFHKKNDSEDNVQHPLLLIKSEILSHLLKNKSEKDIQRRVDEILNTLVQVVEGDEDNNAVKAAFLFLHKLSAANPDASELNSLPVKTSHGLTHKHNRLYSTLIDCESIDWGAFHKDTSVLDTTPEYQFYDEPGHGVNFFKHFCNDASLSSKELYDGKYKLWRFDLNRQVENILQDEGFVTPGSEFSEHSSVNEEEEFDAYILDESLGYSTDDIHSLPLGKRSWDRLGNEKPFFELPFSSESTDNVIHFWNIFNINETRQKKATPIGVEVTLKELITDIKYLLFGVPSSSFYFNYETNTFHIRKNLHTETISPELLLEFCGLVLKCADNFQSLKLFAEKRLRLSFGIVHETFCKCVQHVLNAYICCLLKIEWDNIRYFLHVEPLIIPLERKLAFLAKLCFITIGDRNTGSNFPSGVHLLDYLYSYLLKVFKTDLNYILFYLFESCCNIYLRIVAEWMFDGCFSNPRNYEEFFIEIHREYEICRDWRRVNCITIKEKKVPKFLRKFYKDIFICGKSVNLLKICSSRKILDKIIDQEHPQLKCCFNRKQILNYVSEWENFKLRNSQNFNTNVTIKDKLGAKSDKSDWYKEIKRISQNSIETEETGTTAAKVIGLEISDEEKMNKNSVEETRDEEVTSDSKPTTTHDADSDTKDTPLPESTVAENSQNLEGNKENISKPTPSGVLNSKGNGDGFQNATVSTSETAPANFGGGDAQSSHSEYLRNKMKAMSSTVNSPLPEPTPAEKFATPLRACEENKLKVMSSEYHNRLNAVNNPITNPVLKSTPLRVRDEIKLKIMSSEYHNRLATEKGDEDAVKPKLKNTPLSAREANKVKIMFSEYHDRLQHDEDEDNVALKPRNAPLSDREENKLRVMSSEYHQRLNISLCEPENNAEKLEAAKPALTERDENRMKVLSSEYHQRLNSSMDEPENAEKSEATKPLTERDKNRMKVLSSEYHQRLNASLGESESEGNPKTSKPSECDENRLKGTSSEYHVRLQNLDNGIVEKSATLEVRELTELEKNKLKVMSSEYHTRLNDDADVESQSGASKKKRVTITEPRTDAVKWDTQLDNIAENGDENDAEETGSNEDLTLDAGNSKFYIQDYVFFEKKAFMGSETLTNLNISSVQDVDTTSLFYYLAQSISVPLKIQMKLVNEAILNVFIEKECYLAHLLTLRDYLLLRKPEFSLSITNSLFKLMEKTKKPYTLLNNYILSTILQRAILASSSRKFINYEKRLSFVIEDTIPEAFDLTNIKELNCISLTYSIKWPINILITEPILKKYSKIFKFLLQIQRVVWTLKRDFIALKNLKRGRSMQYVQIQLFRHNMTQIIKVLQDYVMREALETCWNQFAEHLVNVEIDLDVLYMSHLKYINKTLQRCFLCDVSGPCHEVILNLFAVVLKYHEALKEGVWKRNVEVNFLYHTNFKNINCIYEEFNEKLNELRSCLKTLVYTKQKTYFEVLYLELAKNVINGQEAE